LRSFRYLFDSRDRGYKERIAMLDTTEEHMDVKATENALKYVRKKFR
jgi:hypothetical protein